MIILNYFEKRYYRIKFNGISLNKKKKTARLLFVTFGSVSHDRLRVCFSVECDGHRILGRQCARP